MAKPVTSRKPVVCFFHQDRESVTRCYTCGKALCNECAKTYDGEIYCSEKCAENSKKFEQRAEDLQEMDEVYKRKEAANNLQSLLIKIGLFIFFCIVALIVWKTDVVPANVKQNIIEKMPEWADGLKAILK